MRNQKEKPPTWNEFKAMQRWPRLASIEWALEWLVYWLKSMAIFEVLKFVSMLSILVAGITWVWEADDRAKLRPESGTLESRIAHLTGTLNTAARSIEEMSSEIINRQELLNKLQREAKEAENLSKLNADQREAVRQALRTEIARENASSFWSNMLQNVFFTILGIILDRLLSWWTNRKKPQSS